MSPVGNLKSSELLQQKTMMGQRSTALDALSRTKTRKISPKHKFDHKPDDVFTKEEMEDLDTQYLMGYVDWSADKFGYFRTFKNVFGKYVFKQSIYQFFYNIGLAIGTFFMSKVIMPKICNYAGFPRLL